MANESSEGEFLKKECVDQNRKRIENLSNANAVKEKILHVVDQIDGKDSSDNTTMFEEKCVLKETNEICYVTKHAYYNLAYKSGNDEEDLVSGVVKYDNKGEKLGSIAKTETNIHSMPSSVEKSKSDNHGTLISAEKTEVDIHITLSSVEKTDIHRTLNLAEKIKPDIDSTQSSVEKTESNSHSTRSSVEKAESEINNKLSPDQDTMSLNSSSDTSLSTQTCELKRCDESLPTDKKERATGLSVKKNNSEERKGLMKRQISTQSSKSDEGFYSDMDSESSTKSDREPNVQQTENKASLNRDTKLEVVEEVF